MAKTSRVLGHSIGVDEDMWDKQIYLYIYIHIYLSIFIYIERGTYDQNQNHPKCEVLRKTRPPSSWHTELLNRSILQVSTSFAVGRAGSWKVVGGFSLKFLASGFLEQDWWSSTAISTSAPGKFLNGDGMVDTFGLHPPFRKAQGHLGPLHPEELPGPRKVLLEASFWRGELGPTSGV